MGVRVLFNDIWSFVHPNSSLYIRKLVCPGAHLPLRFRSSPWRMYRLKASFTVTVLETRTDQNSFFMGSPLENAGLSFLGYPRVGSQRLRFPTVAPNHRRNSGTDWPEFPLTNAARGSRSSCTIFTRADTNGEALPRRRIKFVPLTSRTMCSSVMYRRLLYSGLRYLSPYLGIYYRKGSARERNTLGTRCAEIRRIHSPYAIPIICRCLYTLEKSPRYVKLIRQTWDSIEFYFQKI